MKTISLLFAFVITLSAQSAGMYQLFLGSSKPLAVGTPVWVNMGDSPCAYPRDQRNPKATDNCMSEYHQAKVVEIFKRDGHWCYKVEFTLPDPYEPKKKMSITRNAWFEDAYLLYNMPDKWTTYSKYFVALNW